MACSTLRQVILYGLPQHERNPEYRIYGDARIITHSSDKNIIQENYSLL